MDPLVVIQNTFPIAIAMIMFGLGLTLKIDDFRRIMVYPKAIVVGLFCQIVLLPLLCFVLLKIAKLEAALAVGFMLLAASPGGVTANLFSHMFKGDVALNITLTAANSVLSAVTLPIVINISLSHFMNQEKYLPMDFSKAAQVFVLVLVPVLLGIWTCSKKPEFSKKLSDKIGIASILFLLFLIGLTIYKEHVTLAKYFSQIWTVALAFNLASLVLGYFLGIYLKLTKPQSLAIAMEVGVHNSALAAAIASSPLLLNNITMAIPAAIYTALMYFTAAGFGFIFRARVRA